MCLVTDKRSTALRAGKNIAGFNEKGLNFLKLCKCSRFWAGKDPDILNECRLDCFELPCSLHSSLLSSAVPIREDRRKQEQTSGPGQSELGGGGAQNCLVGERLGQRSSGPVEGMETKKGLPF